MKISIEYKNGKYTVWYGTISGTGATPKEALSNLIEALRTQLEKFFIA
jgi:hypothetical protein